MRIISDDAVDPAGRTWIALELDLAPGTKTYWSLPGETGIPTTVTLDAGSARIVETAWPYPTRENERYLNYVYYERLVLPMAVEGATDGEVAIIDVRLGLCSDVCVPVDARFEHRFRLSGGDLAQSVRIAQGRALAPLEWPASRGAVADGVSVSAGGLTLTGLHPDIAPESVILEIEGTATLFDAPLTGADGSLAFALLDGDVEAEARNALRLTFMTPEGAFTALLPALEPLR